MLHDRSSYQKGMRLTGAEYPAATGERALIKKGVCLTGGPSAVSLIVDEGGTKSRPSTRSPIPVRSRPGSKPPANASTKSELG
jgi:hypothetical protein